MKSKNCAAIVVFQWGRSQISVPESKYKDVGLVKCQTPREMPKTSWGLKQQKQNRCGTIRMNLKIINVYAKLCHKGGREGEGWGYATPRIKKMLDPQFFQKITKPFVVISALKSPY